MNNVPLTTQGIILKSIPYEDTHRILTLFTQEEGVCSFFAKGFSLKKPHILAMVEPFHLVEIVYYKKRTDLFTLKDISSIDPHLPLRNSLEILKAAHKLSHAIFTSQLPLKPAPRLYALLLTYLKHLTTLPPKTLVASFYLKLLQHEGLLALESSCLRCQTQPATALDQGESVCSLHASPHALSFSEETWKYMTVLSKAHHFHLLKDLEIPEDLLYLIEHHLFKHFYPAMLKNSFFAS